MAPSKLGYMKEYEYGEVETSEICIVISGVYLGFRDMCMWLDNSMKFLLLRWKCGKTCCFCFPIESLYETQLRNQEFQSYY